MKARLARWSAVIGTLLVFGVLARAADHSSEARPQEAMVQLNFPDEVELKALVDYVSQRLGVHILYDEAIGNKRISVRAPGEIPVTSLLDLLKSALRMKGLTLADAEPPGWKRIVDAGQMTSVAQPRDAAKAMRRYGGGMPVTQAFVLKYVDPSQVEPLIKPFLTQPGANSVVLKDRNMLIVTDYASNVLKIAELVQMVDRPKPDVVTEFVKPKHRGAEELAQQISEWLAAREKLDGGRPSSGGVQVMADAPSNHLILIGREADVLVAKRLVESFDVPLQMETQFYALQYVDVERFGRLVQELLAARSAGLLQTAVDRDSNLLIVTAPPELHSRVRSLQERLDVRRPAEASRIRFYKLKNVTATDLLDTLRAIKGAGVPSEEDRSVPGRLRLREGQSLPGPNAPPGQPGEIPPQPPSFRSSSESGALEPSSTPQEELAQGATPLEGAFLADAHVTADPNTNTLIVVADPAVQEMYARLIEVLDQRRAQVLIEARIAIIDTTDDFSLGVEVSAGDRKGDKRLFAFTAHGLSDIDRVTGALSLIPGLGFNGTLVNPQVADVVVRALTTHNRARVIAAPRILVNDNATGVLTSVEEAPFTSVNASIPVATTSFAGFAQAGTTITVTPHVSDGDYLRLDFRITLNSFLGEGGEGVPPARKTNEVESSVTVPDGHTIIVGGLNQTRMTRDLQTVPFIERVPIVKHLSALRTRHTQRVSLFVFLRPVILREDKFKDLKYYSQRDVEKAGVEGRFPKSAPVLIR